MTREYRACPFSILLAGLLLAAGAATVHAQAPAAPILMLDQGGHSAIIKKVLFTPDGRELVSVGDDKLIRVWDTGTGEVLRTLHVPIGPGSEGKLYAAALAPDGTTLAVAGWGTPDTKEHVGDIRLLDLQTSVTLRVLSGHENVIGALAFSPNGLRLASGSSDNTVRLWDVRTGARLQTLRGHDDEVEGVAFSPDGRQVASASYDHTVRVWDVASGEGLHVLRGHEAEVVCVAWSLDGKTIASGSFDHTIRLWDARTGNLGRTLPRQEGQVFCLEFSRDGHRLVTGLGGETTECTVRVWDLPADGLVTEFKKHDNSVSSVAFSPDGTTVASAGGGANEIYLWDTATGIVRHRLAGTGSTVRSVGWSVGGEQVVWRNTYRARTQNDLGPLEHTFQLSMGTSGQDVVAGDAQTTDTRRVTLNLKDIPLKSAIDALFTGSELKYSVDPNVQDVPINVTVREVGMEAALRLLLRQAAIVQPGVTFTKEAGVYVVKIDVGNPNVALLVAAAPQEWTRAVTRQSGRELVRTDDKQGVGVRESGREVLQIMPRGDPSDDEVRCFGFTPTGEIVVGSDFTLALYGPDGKRRQEFVGHVSELRAVSVSPDGRYLASASVDQTVRIWPLHAGPLRAEPKRTTIGAALGPPNATVVSALPDSPAAVAGLKAGDVLLSIDDTPTPDADSVNSRVRAAEVGERLRIRLRRDGRELGFAVSVAAISIDTPVVEPLLSIFRGSDGEWVAWTPEGYYACSLKGERLIGWQVNRSITETPDYYPAYQFRRRFYRPDVIARLLEGGSTAEAVRLADAERHEKTDPQAVVANLQQFAPPRVTVLSPAKGSTVTEAQVTLRARVVDPNDRKLTSTLLLVNGRQQEGKSLVLVSKQEAAGGQELTVGATLIPGENVITLLATNDAGAESLPVSVQLTYRAPEEKPSLYVLSIGVSQYKDPRFALKYAAKDAQDFAAAWQRQEGKLFGKVTVKLLTDDGATHDDVEDALEWLGKSVTQKDWAVVFVSGHGLPDNLNQYCFAPYNVDPDRLKRTGVVWSDFHTSLAHLPGKVLLALDTCHSAGVTGEQHKGEDAYTELLRDASSDEAGLITFASCMAREESLERDDWNNGAFTKAMVEGLDGKADANGDGTVTVAELDSYVTNRVKELTGGRQHPTTQRPSSIQSGLPLAWLR